MSAAKYEEGIKCDLCQFWVHAGCEGFSNEECKMLGKLTHKVKM